MKDHVIVLYDYTEPGCTILRGDTKADAVRKAFLGVAGADNTDSEEWQGFVEEWPEVAEEYAAGDFDGLVQFAQDNDTGVEYDGPDEAS